MVKVIAPHDVRAMSLPGRHARELISGSNGAHSSTLRLVEISPEVAGETRRGPHMHNEIEECIYVIEGEGVTRTEDGEFPVHSGDTVLVAAGERHATYNTGSCPLKLLCFFPVSDIRPISRECTSWTEDEIDA